jgi:hypothetical protein
LVPLSFGGIHGTVTDANGNVVDEFCARRLRRLADGY